MIPICLGFTIVPGYDHVSSNIELSTVVEERTNYVLLHNQGRLLFFLGCFSYSLLNILQFVSALDTVTSVTKLSRLDYPIVMLLLLLSLAVISSNPVILRIKKSMADNKGFGDNIKHIQIV